MLDCLELVHYHIGSQITAIRAHRDALREAGRVLAGLHRLGATPRILDVGGGPVFEDATVDRLLRTRYEFRTKLLINATRYEILSSLNELRWIRQIMSSLVRQAELVSDRVDKGALDALATAASPPGRLELERDITAQSTLIVERMSHLRQVLNRD